MAGCQLRQALPTRPGFNPVDTLRSTAHDSKKGHLGHPHTSKMSTLAYNLQYWGWPRLVCSGMLGLGWAKANQQLHTGLEYTARRDGTVSAQPQPLHLCSAQAPPSRPCFTHLI